MTMKYFLTIVLLLASVSCATHRQKSKHTERAESSQYAKKSTTREKHSAGNANEIWQILGENNPDLR